MVHATLKPAKPPRRQPKAGPMYRGIRLATPVAQTRFSLEELKRVVHEVFAMPKDATTGGK
jgi:hypothetical protein